MGHPRRQSSDLITTPVIAVLANDPEARGRCVIGRNGAIVAVDVWMRRIIGLAEDADPRQVTFRDVVADLDDLLDAPPSQGQGHRSVLLQRLDDMRIWARCTVVATADHRFEVSASVDWPKMWSDSVRHGDLIESILDAMRAGVYVKDAAGHYVHVNPACAKFLCRPMEEIIGATDHDLMSPEAAAPITASDRRVMDTMTSRTYEEVLTARGSTRVYKVSKHPWVGENGAVMGLIGVRENVTDHKRAEHELRASEGRFRQLAESIDQVFWISSARDRQQIVFASPAYERIWGRSRESLYEQPGTFFETVHPQDRQRVQSRFDAFPADGFEEEYRIVRPDGAIRWIRSRAFPVRNGDGPVVRLAGTSEDITERKSIEDQLRQAVKMDAIGRLAGGVAHDFNNLLAIISSYGELARDGLERDDQRYQDLEEIRLAVQKSAGLIRQLMAFSRTGDRSPETLLLNELLPEMGKMLHRLIGEDMELRFQLGADLGSIEADPTHIEQIVMNLVVNARHATSAGGTVTIETANVDKVEGVIDAVGGPWVMLRVGDTGSGMDEGTLCHMFEPFFTTKPHGEGTGLGLSTVYGLVKQSRGHITVDSAVGVGTSFTIYLPWLQEQSTTADLEPISEQSGGSETILLVEDEEQVRVVLRRVLERAGYAVLVSATPGDALLAAEQHEGPIALLLTDVVMPRMNGFQLADRLARTRPELRVRFMSGYPMARLIEEVEGAAEIDLLSKPVTPDQLLQAVRATLDEVAASS